MSDTLDGQDRQQGSSDKEAAPPLNTESSPPATDPNPDSASKTEDSPKTASAAQKETLDAIKRGEKISLTIAGIVAFCTIGQWFTSCNNNKSTAIQSDKLIRAAQMSAHSADHNAASAFSFSQSAHNINNGITEAVKKLDAQARALDLSREASERQSRKALQATIDNFHLDQRAWVGVQSIAIDDSVEYPKEDPTAMRTADSAGVTIAVKGVSFSIVNSGKTPAIITDFNGVMHLGRIDVSSRVFTSEEKSGMSKSVPIKVLIPGQTGKGEFAGSSMTGTLRRYPAIRVEALICYKDLWGGPHTTKVCFYSFVPYDGPNTYTYCPEPDSNSEN